MDSQVQYNSEKQPIKKVYYEGSDNLRAGYGLCYNADSNSLQGAADTTAAVANIERMVRVEKPTVANAKHFAGVVSAGDDGKTGPCWITIHPPTANGFGVNLWTTANCTVASTQLFLVGGSYAFSTSGNRLVAEALQTVDRSTTAGTVLAVLKAPVLSGTVREPGASTTFTSAIWQNFPVAAMRMDPTLGTFGEFDPATNPTAVLPPYAAYTGAHNTVARAKGTTLAETDQLVLSQDASTADNDAVAVQLPGPIVVSGGKPWAVEVEYDLTTVTNADMESLVGLAAVSTLANAMPFADGGALADVDALIFDVKADDGNSVDVSYRANGETAVVHDADVKAPTANTAFSVGLYYDGTDINVYVDGVDTEDPILAADIASITDIFPAGVTMYPTFAGKADSGVADGDDLNIRAFRYAQLA